MLNKLKKNFQTIKGKTAILIGSFLVMLLFFSFYVYITVKKNEKNYSEFIHHWHALQVNLFTTFKTYTDIQYASVKAVYNQESDTIGIRSNIISGMNSYDLNFKVHFDSVQVGFDYVKVINEEKSNFKNAMEVRIAILNRISELKKNNQSEFIYSDSIIKNVYLPKIDAASGNYWSLFFPAMIVEINKGTKNSDDLISDSYKYFLFFVLVLTSILVVVYLYCYKIFITSLQHSIQQPIDALNQLSTGELKLIAVNTKDELAEVVEASNNLSQKLTKASDFSIAIGKGNFDFEFEPISPKDTLGNALIHMRNELKMYAEKEKQATWVNVGLAKFAQILRKSDASVTEISDTLLTELIKYLNANQGGVFLYDKATNLLHLKACYAYERKKFIEKEVKIGEGLLGQCFLEADSIVMTDLPKDYVHITSGLGKSNPKILVLMPMIDNNQVLGVIEIASFHKLEEFQVDFIRKVAENFAAVILSISKNELNLKLLEESNINRENMKQQEEEMRQNMEELIATQEELQRKENAYISEIAKLKENQKAII